ncbi:MAG: hypothetical protein ACP5D2_01490 [Candidatus Nanoarchaeia archaeon]
MKKLASTILSLSLLMPSFSSPSNAMYSPQSYHLTNPYQVSIKQQSALKQRLQIERAKMDFKRIVFYMLSTCHRNEREEP